MQVACLGFTLGLTLSKPLSKPRFLRRVNAYTSRRGTGRSKAEVIAPPQFLGGLNPKP